MPLKAYEEFEAEPLCFPIRGKVGPARAGMIPRSQRRRSLVVRRPRASGDDPYEPAGMVPGSL